MKFQPIHLGQSILKYQVPYDIFRTINVIYEAYLKKLPKANNHLIGKIKNEHSLFYSRDDKDVKKHNFLTKEVYQWFEHIFLHYLTYNKIVYHTINIDSIWINEMKEYEYNPAHVHKGNLSTGLSSVLVLKLPSTYGKEYSREDFPTNGKLQLFGSSSGQFAKVDYEPEMKVGDFYVFPYDMRHCVYPFNETNETRRTLAANCDVDYSRIQSTGVK